MHDLRLVGVHDDGEHVVLAGSDGSRYRLRVDEALRAAVRRDRARLGQLQIQSSAELRPREIQARIRAGETAEEIAELAGIPVANVRRYEGPVLAERLHVSDLARRTPFGRRDASGTARELEELVVQRLTARAVDPEGVRWDAWKQEDGGWSVQLEFVAGGRGRVARWWFDVGARSLSAADDEARWLSEEAPADTGPLPPRRLSSVGEDAARRGRERVYDIEADGGVRAATTHRDPTEDLLDALSERRGQRPPAGADAHRNRTHPAEDTGPRARPLDPAPGARASTSPVPGTDPAGADVPAAHPAASHPDDLPDDRVLHPAEVEGAPELPEPAAPAPGEPQPQVVAEPADSAPETVGPAPETGAAAPVDDDAAGQPAAGPVVEAEAAAPAVADPAQADVTATDAGDAAPAPADPAPAPADAAPTDPAPADAAEGPAGGAGEEQPSAEPPAKAAAPRPRPPRSGRGRQAGGRPGQKRPSVPSWDEIMFGAKRD